MILGFANAAATVELSDWVQICVGCLNAVGLGLVVWQIGLSGKSQKTAIYQALEIESNSVFQFEAANKAVVQIYKTQLAPSKAERKEIIFDPLVARKYYENTCNLFEVSARLREQKIVDADVFASWVAWYFDTLTEWGFRALWHELRDNYTKDLREIFDAHVDDLIRSWDQSHERGAFTHYMTGDVYSATGDTSPQRWVSVKELEARRTSFYNAVGNKFKCPIIAGWLDTIDHDSLPKRPRHPLAYR